MYVLHAHWQPRTAATELGSLCLWGEKSDAHTPREKLDRRRRTAQPHPFAVEQPQLRDLLMRLCGLDLKGPGAAQGETVLALRLPTGRTAPQPSPQLIHEWKFDEGALALLPWEMPMLALGAAEALHLLVALPTTELPYDIRLGDDLYFWRTAALLALEALAQHKLQPGLQSDAAGKLSARWLPVLDGPRDGPRLARLVAAMPPLCRAAPDGDSSSGRGLLDSFLTFLVDGALRDWCGVLLPKSVSADATAHAWLSALLRKDARVQVSGAQGQRLYASYRAWLRTLHAAGDKNFRVTLRLDVPAPADGGEGPPPWTLHYLLQARDDPSLLIDAQDLWQPRNTLLSGLKERLHNPQELLLGGLGFAARHCEPVRHSLNEKRPAFAVLSSEEAFDYMRHTAPLLETSGFGVLVPPWWNQPGARLGLRVRMKGASAGSDGVGRGLLTMDNLVRYRWELAVGGEPLSREEFESLVALKSPLVQVRGKWVQLDAEQVEAAIRFWQKQQDQEAEIGLLDAAAMALDGAEVNGLPVEGVETEGWLQEWFDHFTGNEKLSVLPPPARLSALLRPYQAYGYSWLEFQRRWGIGVCLADDMGLGKTIQTLAMLQRVKEQAGALPAPVLLVAPTSVVVNWAKEAARFTPDLRTLVHQGAQRLRGEEFGAAAREHDLVATSYALVRRDAAVLQSIDWFGVILDEAQNIKNPATRQTQAIRQLPANFRLALTGTPVENRLSELWSIMHFLNPGFLGSQRTFRERLCPTHRALWRRAGRGALAPPGLALHAAPGQNRPHRDPGFAGQTGDQGILHPYRRSRPRFMKRWCVSHCRQIESAEEHPAQGHGAGDVDEAEADLQPSGAIPAPDGRRDAATRIPWHAAASWSAWSSCSTNCWTPATARSSSRSSPRWVDSCAQLSAGSLWRAGALSARRHAGPPAQRVGGALPAGCRRAAPLRAFTEGRRHRAQSDTRQPRLSLRPLVEPGCGGSGHRPRIPHRPEAKRPGAQVRLRGHA